MESGGIKIGSVQGIPIRVHFTLFLALPLVALGFSRAFRAAADLAGIPPEGIAGSPWLWGFGVAVALFGSVLLHELAHSLYALRKGGAVREITLLMIGGVSQLSRAPGAPRHEAVMALVGPLVSLALGAALYGSSLAIPTDAFSARFALFYLGSLNLVLGLFNLLPAFPMDGGRILRASLAGRLGALKATRIAAQVGKVFAVLFGLWGLMSFNLFLLLIAFFVWLGAEGELQYATQRSVLGKLKVRDVMSRDPLVVAPQATAREVAEQMLSARRPAFVLTADGLPLGSISLEAVGRVPTDRRDFVLARELATMVPVVAPGDDLGAVLRELGEGDVAVMEQGSFVGTVTREDLVRAWRYRQLEEKVLPPPSWTQRPLGR